MSQSGQELTSPAPGIFIVSADKAIAGNVIVDAARVWVAVTVPQADAVVDVVDVVGELLLTHKQAELMREVE